jgi:adenine-specific DNA-methyltransferase
MLKFADLEALPDTTYLHAIGTVVSGQGSGVSDQLAVGSKNTDHQPPPTDHYRVAVSFGPEHAALEQRQVEMALREAEKIRPTPRYIVFTAFTFDPEAAKDIDEMKWPGVTLLKAQMNTDLLTEDLKKARSNNQSFWLMGQPDVAVVGGQWLVDSFGEALLPYERFEELSGVGGLDEIDGLGYCGVPSDKEVSEGGNLRSGGADAAGGSVYPIEHRRRAIAELHRRISELSGYRARFSGGTGNPGDAVGKAGLSSVGSGNTAHATNSGSWSPAQWSDALAQLKALTADHLPLTTAHLFQVEVNGFDYFDTAKGELVSGGKNKIAMWSLDTDYDERSLFPRQVFFPMAGKGEGWEKLKKDIRAELDESLLGKFQGTVSLPFEAGENRKIAVKIVDDRGIESLKIVALN